MDLDRQWTQRMYVSKGEKSTKNAVLPRPSLLCVDDVLELFEEGLKFELDETQKNPEILVDYDPSDSEPKITVFGPKGPHKDKLKYEIFLTKAIAYGFLMARQELRAEEGAPETPEEEIENAAIETQAFARDVIGFIKDLYQVKSKYERNKR